MVTETVLCPHCKRPVDAKLQHPVHGDYWMARCEGCDSWPVIAIKK